MAAVFELPVKHPSYLSPPELVIETIRPESPSTSNGVASQINLDEEVALNIDDSTKTDMLPISDSSVQPLGTKVIRPNYLPNISLPPVSTQPSPQNLTEKSTFPPMSPSNKRTSFEELPRTYNTGQELVSVVSRLGVNKSRAPWDKILFLGFLAGIWVVFAGLFTMVVVGGVPVDVRARWPVIPKLLTAATFPIGLVFIMLFGGELFTGNTMIMAVAYLNKKVTTRQIAINWILVFFSNLFTILLFTYVFGVVTEFFATEPYKSWVLQVALKKANYAWYKSLIMGIPANALVCLAFFLGLAARDVTGKILGLYLPIATFAATGWEHCVANMFFIPLGMYYGAEISVGTFISNTLLVSIGNIIGGSVLIAGSEYYMYHWHHDTEPTKHIPGIGRFPHIKAVYGLHRRKAKNSPEAEI